MEQYQEYASLEAKIKELTTQKDVMRTAILSYLESNDIAKDETPFGTFTRSSVKSWTYTDSVNKAEEEYKALKAKEESTGEATYTEKPSLRFTSIKL